jgi:hypothetical protein
MTPLPPIRRAHDSHRSRRVRRERRSGAGGVREVGAALAVLAAVLLAASCSGPPVSSVASPVASSEDTALDGLLVAGGGALRVTDPAGDLAAFDAPAGPTVAVSASADGTVVALGEDLRLVAASAGAQRRWRPVSLATDGTGERPWFALSPDGSRLAVAAGELGGRTFELVLVPVSGADRRSVTVDRGLNGAPVWIGPQTVAINTFGADQRAVFTGVDLASAGLTDLPTLGSLLSASADGTRIALDEATTGDVLVGARARLDDAGLAGYARLRGLPGFAPVDLALDPGGARLAIVRQSDRATSIELLVRSETNWTSARILTLRDLDALSVAWLR